MLAYVFWHRPNAGVDAAAYEDAQRSFHSSLETPSASFRVARMPFAATSAGYEDWYLVESWSELGELSEIAVDSARRPAHDHAAAMSAAGWGAVFAPVRGRIAIPAGTEWFEKPRGEPYAEFIATLPEITVWQRQMVLGPGPEFCAAAPESEDRTRIWPDR
jgi:hypothetical protein